jgi:hypothetical protein
LVPGWPEIARSTEAVYRAAGAKMGLREAMFTPATATTGLAGQSISAAAP